MSTLSSLTTANLFHPVNMASLAGGPLGMPTPEQVAEEIDNVLVSRPLRRLAWRLDLTQDDQEEVRQNLNVRALHHLHLYDPNRPLANWLARLASRGMIDMVRRRRWIRSFYDPQGQLVLDPPAGTDNPLDQLIAQETAARLVEALERVSPRVRAVALLRMEGLDNHQIAARLGIRPGAVACAMHRFKKAALPES